MAPHAALLLCYQANVTSFQNISFFVILDSILQLDSCALNALLRITPKTMLSFDMGAIFGTGKKKKKFNDHQPQGQ